MRSITKWSQQIIEGDYVKINRSVEFLPTTSKIMERGQITEINEDAVKVNNEWYSKEDIEVDTEY